MVDFSRSRKRRKIVIITVAGTVAVIAILAVVGCIVPVTGSSAIAVAKAKQAFQPAELTYGQLVTEYEKAVGVEGTWRAELTNGDHWSWNVTYTHPQLGVLWFGVQFRWSVYMNDTTPAITQRMIDAISRH